MLLLAASVVFYAAGTPWHLAVLAVPAIVDYACALRIEDSGDSATRKRWLDVQSRVESRLLAYFKYADFFPTRSTALRAQTPCAARDVALPVGISFFTFETMSYTSTSTVASPGVPQLLAISRSSCRSSRSCRRPDRARVDLSAAAPATPRVRHRRTRGRRPSDRPPRARQEDRDRRQARAVCRRGVRTPEPFSQGTVSARSSPTRCRSTSISRAIRTWPSASRGCSVRLAREFRLAVPGDAITDFWRRWHISLSPWLRDYLYIPLGGNRRGPGRTYVNLCSPCCSAASGTARAGPSSSGGCCTASGWPRTGAGAANANHRRPTRGSRRSSLFARGPPTYAFVCAGWMFFRAADFGSAAVVRSGKWRGSPETARAGCTGR